jgi:hypothetical protein
MKSDTTSTENRMMQKMAFIILLLFSLHFWEIRGLPQSLNIENLITWAVGIFAFVIVMKKKDMHFTYAILIFLSGLVFNSLAAYFNLGQNPIKTILSFEFSWFILLYFVLHYLNPSRKYLEKLIIVFALIYSVLFIFQYTVYPTVIFRSDKNTAVWSKQFEIMGNGFLMLAYFLVLNRYLLYQKILNLLLALFFFSVLFYSDFRTLIGAAAVVTVFMLVRIFHRPKDIIKIVFVGLLFLGVTQQGAISKVIDKMVLQTAGNIKEGKNYVRLVQVEFFFKKYPQNFSYFVIGGGKPSGANLFRFNRSSFFGMNYNIVWVDIGILGYYIVVGGIATLGLLIWVLRAIFIRLPRDWIYLSSYFLYLLVSSLTNEEIYRNGIFTVQAIALYLVDLGIKERDSAEYEAQKAKTELQQTAAITSGS